MLCSLYLSLTGLGEHFCHSRTDDNIPHQSFPTDAEETFGRYFLADCMTDALV